MRQLALFEMTMAPTRRLRVEGPGTVTWNPVGFLGANGINNPLNINGGLLVLLESPSSP